MKFTSQPYIMMKIYEVAIVERVLNVTINEKYKTKKIVR